MPYYKFNKNDIFHNTIEAKPEVKFDINDCQVYLNNLNKQSGAIADNITHVPTGFLSLYELNIDRQFAHHTYDAKTDQGVKAKIFPFIEKDGSLEVLQGVSALDYQTEFEEGSLITGSYPFSASLSRQRFATNHGATSPADSHIMALKNTLNYYTPISPHYAFSSPLGNKALQELSLLHIPSIFYGSSIDKGTVDLKFFVSGTLVARARDIYRNGELIQTDGTAYAKTQASGAVPTGQNQVAGVVLYDEGIIALTGSWNLTEESFNFGDVTRFGNWINFAAGGNDTNSYPSVTPKASFSINFNGVKNVETITMFAHADKNKLNYSTNHTIVNYASASANPPVTGSNKYIENSSVPLANTVSSSFYEYEEKFKHQTFINKIGIYDEKKNLIAVANLATPIKKTAERDFTFKLKLDI